VSGDVRHPHRLRVGDQQTEHAAAVRQVADRLVRLRIDAVGDEVGQQAVRADHAERAVTGPGQGAGGLDDPLQGAAQVELRADADHRVEQGAQPFPAGHHLTDPVEHLLQQLVQPDPGQRAEPERRRFGALVPDRPVHPVRLAGPPPPGRQRRPGVRSCARDLPDHGDRAG
jgi:hypothetical protein